MSETVDPICGMTVNIAAPKGGSAVHGGKTYFFCSARCREQFNSDPTAHLHPATPYPSKEEAPPSAELLYICPMDPEVRQDHPGACPKCGMALEPIAPLSGGSRNPELHTMTLRFWVSLVFTGPLLLLEMTGMASHSMGQAKILWECFLATPAVLWGGLPFFERGWRSVVNRSLNMFTLIALGTAVAYLYSVIILAVLALHIALPGLHTGVYFESASVIVTLVLLGQVLELRARERTSGAIRALMGLAPKSARRIRGAIE